MANFKMIQESISENKMIVMNFQIIFEKLEDSYELDNKLFISKYLEMNHNNILYKGKISIHDYRIPKTKVQLKSNADF